MGRRTERDDARDMLAELTKRGFRICERVPKADRTYHDGVDAKEWEPLHDTRAERVLEVLALIPGSNDQ